MVSFALREFKDDEPCHEIRTQKQRCEQFLPGISSLRRLIYIEWKVHDQSTGRVHQSPVVLRWPMIVEWRTDGPAVTATGSWPQTLIVVPSAPDHDGIAQI